jgi:pyridoxamine 5'-phosphate oxidase-like protein
VHISSDLREFLSEKIPAIVGTARRDRSVQIKPIWFELRDDGQIWVNGGPKRRWYRRAKRRGQLALFFIDPKSMWRHALIQCRLVEATTDGADDHIDRLSQRYLGFNYRNPKIDRLIVKLEPTHVSGFNNGKPWIAEEGEVRASS